MGNPVMFFEIASKQGQLLRDFYRDLFDWTILPFNWNIPHFPNDIFAIDPTPPPLDDKGIKGHIYPLSDDMDFSNRVSILYRLKTCKKHSKRLKVKAEKRSYHRRCFLIVWDQSRCFLTQAGTLSVYIKYRCNCNTQLELNLLTLNNAMI